MWNRQGTVVFLSLTRVQYCVMLVGLGENSAAVLDLLKVAGRRPSSAEADCHDALKQTVAVQKST
jgi:hypothetical protein